MFSRWIATFSDISYKIGHSLLAAWKCHFNHVLNRSVLLIKPGLKNHEGNKLRRETHKVSKKKKRQWEKDVHKYLMSKIKQKGHV